MNELNQVSQFADSLTAFGLLLVFIWIVLFKGLLKTKEHHTEVVDGLKADNTRAWTMVDSILPTLAANNKVLEKLADAQHDQLATMNRLSEAVERLSEPQRKP